MVSKDYLCGCGFESNSFLISEDTSIGRRRVIKTNPRMRRYFTFTQRKPWFTQRKPRFTQLNSRFTNGSSQSDRFTHRSSKLWWRKPHMCPVWEEFHYSVQFSPALARNNHMYSSPTYKVKMIVQFSKSVKTLFQRILLCIYFSK
jgi:hypothetical protein